LIVDMASATGLAWNTFAKRASDSASAFSARLRLAPLLAACVAGDHEGMGVEACALQDHLRQGARVVETHGHGWIPPCEAAEPRLQREQRVIVRPVLFAPAGDAQETNEWRSGRGRPLERGFERIEERSRRRGSGELGDSPGGLQLRDVEAAFRKETRDSSTVLIRAHEHGMVPVAKARCEKAGDLPELVRACPEVGDVGVERNAPVTDSKRDAGWRSGLRTSRLRPRFSAHACVRLRS
jgi:hypothetical protein